MLNFFKNHWLLIMLAVIATLLAIVWVQGKSNKTAKQSLPNLPSIAYPNLTGQKVPPAITFNLTGTDLPTQVSLYQISQPTVFLGTTIYGSPAHKVCSFDSPHLISTLSMTQVALQYLPRENCPANRWPQILFKISSRRTTLPPQGQLWLLMVHEKCLRIIFSN